MPTAKEMWDMLTPEQQAAPGAAQAYGQPAPTTPRTTPYQGAPVASDLSTQDLGFTLGGYQKLIQDIYDQYPDIRAGNQDLLNAEIVRRIRQQRADAGGTSGGVLMPGLETVYESPEMEAARLTAMRLHGINAMENAEVPKLKRATLGAMAERGIGLGGLSEVAMGEALGRARGEWQDRRGDLLSAATGQVNTGRASKKQYELDLSNLNLQKESNELAKQQWAAQQNAANAKTGFSSWGPKVTGWMREAQGRWW